MKTLPQTVLSEEKDRTCGRICCKIGYPSFRGGLAMSIQLIQQYYAKVEQMCARSVWKP